MSLCSLITVVRGMCRDEEGTTQGAEKVLSGAWFEACVCTEGI